MSNDPTWFSGARFGIFIHWGIYSVGPYEASWAFYNHGAPGQDPSDSIPRDEYMKQAGAFFARRYDPQAWCELFRKAGATYTVLTTKHHDGVALWDTAEGLSTVRDTAAARDLVAPFADAARAAGLHLGLYYSHLDWNHPDYPSVRGEGIPPLDPKHPGYDYAYARGADDPVRWANFLRFHRLQLRELCERFSPDLLWFDGDWERSPGQWKFAELREQLRSWRPGVILNSRMGGYGDYATPEQGIPTTAPKGAWELCLTINRSWSMAMDASYKTTQELVHVLCECAGMGGNLLLNVSPLPDGTIFFEQKRLLLEIGAWMDVHGQAIHGTKAGLPATHFYGPSTVSDDGTKLYLFVFDKPWGEIALKGLHNKVKAARVLGHEGKLKHRVSGGASWAGVPGVLWLTVPEASCNPLATVVELELEGTLNVHHGEGQVITQN